MERQITLPDALGTKRAWGVPYASGPYNTQWPIAGNIGPVRLHDLRGGIGLPSPPRDVDDYIEANLPTHPRGDAETDHEIVRLMLGHPFGRPKTKAEYRRAIEFFAMPVGALEPSPERDAAAACTSAVYPWGEGRDRFRLEIEEQRRKDEEARAEAAERARIAALPNTKTLRELGFVGVLLPVGTSPTSWPQWISWSSQFPPSAELRAGAVSHPEGDVLFFRARFGVDFGEEAIAGTPCRFVSDFAPAKKPSPKARPLPFEALAARHCDSSAIEMSRDGRTPEGEKAEEDFRVFCNARKSEMAPLLRNLERHGVEMTMRFASSEELTNLGHLVAQAGRRGFGLRRELLKHVIHDLFPGVWSDARLDKRITQAEGGAEAAWFSPNELYSPPSPSFVQRFSAVFGEERQWRRVLEGVVDGKDFVLKSDCEEAIIAASLAPKFTNDEWERLLRVMTALGFKDGRKAIDGETKRGFVRKDAP